MTRGRSPRESNSIRGPVNRVWPRPATPGRVLPRFTPNPTPLPTPTHAPSGATPQMTSRLDWPDGIDRTPPSERERTRRYSVQFRQTEQEIAEEMERLGVESWWMDDVKGSGTDPGIVVRWRKDGKDYAVACDAYTTKKANARDVFLWLKESRKRDERETVTVGDNLAAAQLPPGDPEATAMGNGADSALPDGVEPHDILGVPPDASDDEVTERARELIIEYHPDQSEKGPEYVQSVKAARDAMTSG